MEDSSRPETVARNVLLVLGVVDLVRGIRLNGVSMQSEFNGKYMMLVYLLVCIVTFVYFIVGARRHETSPKGVRR